VESKIFNAWNCRCCNKGGKGIESESAHNAKKVPNNKQNKTENKTTTTAAAADILIEKRRDISHAPY
jgi:hypothetical protein